MSNTDNVEEPPRVLSKEETIEAAVIKFRETSKAMLQAFLFLEQELQEAAQLCVDLSALLDDQPKPNPNQTNIFEGDINVN